MSEPRTFYLRHAAAVTLHDTNVNDFTCLYIGVSGDVTVRLKDDAGNVTFKSVPIGFLPVQVKLVLSTGTTATNIIGLNMAG